MKNVPHLIADELDQAILVELRGERLRDAIDGGQLGGAFPDFVLALIDEMIGAGVVERDGGVGGEVFEQAEVLLGVGVFLEALHAEHAQNTVLRDERQVDHRCGRLCGAAVFEDAVGVLVRRNVLLGFGDDVVDQHRLAVVDTPDGELILVSGAAGVGGVALPILDGQAIFDQVFLRPVEAHAEDAGVHDLVDALIELEQDGVQIQRSRDFLADLAEQLHGLVGLLEMVFLRGDFGGLGTNFLRAFGDRNFQGLGLRLQSFRFAARLFAFVIDHSLAGANGA